MHNRRVQHIVRSACEHKRIIPIAAIDNAALHMVFDRVIPRTATNGVIPCATIKMVAETAPVKRVIPVTGDNRNAVYPRAGVGL